ncbi:MAG: tRNA (guanosine(46)-N7)-methyltransferase TrmB [Legionellaceae bacterium]|nr:tRNA (guanosine(46)-N7)-methyltransferase TrmB [Legionellaceae bacterium]
MLRTIKSFTLRAGRLSPRQARALDLWLPDYVLPVEGQLWDLAKAFGREAETVVEIGFGMGASLIEMAQARPDINFLGIEVHRAGVGSLVADVHDLGLTNVRVVAHDAVEVFNTCLSPESIDGVQIFFPDPWHKARHHKRRLIQTDFVRVLLQAIKIGGFVHCATDWEDYANQMLEVLSNESMLENKDVNSSFFPRPERRPLTKFEARGQRLGHGTWDLMFTRII